MTVLHDTLHNRAKYGILMVQHSGNSFYGAEIYNIALHKLLAT